MSGSVFIHRRHFEPVTTLLSSDSFNGRSAMGQTDGAGTLDPLTWATASGVWTVTSSQACTTTAPGMVTCPLGTANADVSVTTSVTDTNGQGVVVRLSDASNYILFFGSNNTNCTLRKTVAGVNTTLLTAGQNVLTGGIMRVRCSGNTIEVFIDGVSYGSVSEAFNNTAQNFGMRSQGTSQRFDNWLAYAA